MKIAITATGKELTSLMDVRFGRCAYFIVFDGEEMNALPNEARLVSGGAGIASANFIVKEGIEILITGNLGPNAEVVLREAGVKVYCSKVKTIKEVWEAYQQRRLKLLDIDKGV